MSEEEKLVWEAHEIEKYLEPWEYGGGGNE
jgi:hypothetical protein